MIFLAPFADSARGNALAPHTLLAVRNRIYKSHPVTAEIPTHHYDGDSNADIVAEALHDYSDYLVLGGDHTITLGILRSKAGPTHVVMFDAHRDDYAAETRPYPTHGNWLRYAIDEGLVSGVTWYNYRDQPVAMYGEPLSKTTTVHVSVDVDVLEPSEYGWGANYPEPGGCTVSTLIKDLQGLGRFNVESADLVEYDPSLDQALVGARALSPVIDTLLELIGA